MQVRLFHYVFEIDKKKMLSCDVKWEWERFFLNELVMKFIAYRAYCGTSALFWYNEFLKIF